MSKRSAAIGLGMALAATSLAAPPAQAAGMIYSNPGVAITQSYSFEKLTDGDLLISFMGGAANYKSYLGVIVNGIDLGLGLSNKVARGTTWNYGFVEAGSSIIFYLDVENTGLTYSSVSSLNPDGLNHLYAGTYGGGNRIGGKWFARTQYAAIGFEDMQGGGDNDYDDARFIAEQVGLAPYEPAPEPAAWAMMLVGFGLVGMAARSKRTA
ncbi:MAG: hypothetical protein DI568_03510 [Sphingomonas sp.]|nr:MAG: hypothetical protein DI568_03510 [Sphingomonas sp.]